MTKLLDTHRKDVCRSAQAGHDITFTGFNNEFSKRIDFIFGMLPPNVHVARCGSFDWDWDESQKASDHRLAVSHIVVA